MDSEIKKALMDAFFALPKEEQNKILMAVLKLVPTLAPVLTKELLSQLLLKFRGQ